MYILWSEAVLFLQIPICTSEISGLEGQTEGVGGRWAKLVFLHTWSWNQPFWSDLNGSMCFSSYSGVQFKNTYNSNYFQNVWSTLGVALFAAARAQLHSFTTLASGCGLCLLAVCCWAGSTRWFHSLLPKSSCLPLKWEEGSAKTTRFCLLKPKQWA